FLATWEKFSRPLCRSKRTSPGYLHTPFTGFSKGFSFGGFAMPNADTVDHPELRDSVIYWFAALDQARQRGRFAFADYAQRQLRRLGVLVDFVPPSGEVSDDGR